MFQEVQQQRLTSGMCQNVGPTQNVFSAVDREDGSHNSEVVEATQDRTLIAEAQKNCDSFVLSWVTNNKKNW